MTLTGVEGRARVIAQRAIDRGSMSVSLLARKSGYSQSHVSNWLHGGRAASCAALDTILTALGIELELVPIVKSEKGQATPPPPSFTGESR